MSRAVALAVLLFIAAGLTSAAEEAAAAVVPKRAAGAAPRSLLQACRVDQSRICKLSGFDCYLKEIWDASPRPEGLDPLCVKWLDARSVCYADAKKASKCSDETLTAQAPTERSKTPRGMELLRRRCLTSLDPTTLSAECKASDFLKVLRSSNRRVTLPRSLPLPKKDLV